MTLIKCMSKRCWQEIYILLRQNCFIHFSIKQSDGDSHKNQPLEQSWMANWFSNKLFSTTFCHSLHQWLPLGKSTICKTQIEFPSLPAKYQFPGCLTYTIGGYSWWSPLPCYFDKKKFKFIISEIESKSEILYTFFPHNFYHPLISLYLFILQEPLLIQYIGTSHELNILARIIFLKNYLNCSKWIYFK